MQGPQGCGGAPSEAQGVQAVEPGKACVEICGAQGQARARNMADIWQTYGSQGRARARHMAHREGYGGAGQDGAWVQTRHRIGWHRMGADTA